MAWGHQLLQSVGARIAAGADFLRSIRHLHVLRAERHAKQGQVESAEAIYRQILIRRPRHNAALAGLGRLLLRERRFEEAVEIWQRSVDLEPQHAGCRFQFARALHRSGRFEAAASQYLRVVVLDPLHGKAFAALEQLTDRLTRTGAAGSTAVDAASQIAQQLLSLEASTPGLRDRALRLMAALHAGNDPEGAARYWHQLAESNPSAIEPRLQLGRHFTKLKRMQDARDHFQAVLDLEPRHSEALLGYNLTLAEFDSDTAVRYLEAATARHFEAWSRRDPTDSPPLVKFARLPEHSTKGGRAEAAYRDVARQMPSNPAALTQLAQVLSRNLSRIEPALETWQRVADCDPGSPYPLVQRAQLLERVRRPQEAETEYRAALARAPRDESALFGLARLLSAQSRWNEAIEYHSTLHGLKPRRTDVLLGLGRCLERLDRPGEALATYEKVLALDPVNANGQLYRGRLLRQLGRTDEAIAAWQQICRTSPANADAWYELVFMLASMEREDEALAALHQAEVSLPATAASWARLGLAAQAGQFHDRAVGFLERAIAADPQDAAHHSRLGQHYLRRGILDRAFRHLHASRELKPNDATNARQLVDAIHGLNVLGVDHLCLQTRPPREGEVLVPEGLFRKVRALADGAIVPYVPVPGRIIAVSSSLAGGGAERQLVNLLRGLGDPAFGVELALFCISLARQNRRDFFLPLLDGTPVDIVTPDDVGLETYLADPVVAPHALLIRAFPADMVLPIAFWLVEFRRRRPQVVHAWQDATNLTAVVAALLAGVPKIVLGARSVRPDNPRRRLKRFMRDGYRAVLGHPSVVLTNNSRAGANDYADWLEVSPANIEVVYNGIDFDQLARQVDASRVQQARSRLGIPADAFVVGSAFRMSEEKRPTLWVEVAAEVAHHESSTHFIVYGDGPMRSDMLQLAGRLGIADRLHLPGSEEEIASCFKAMDLVLLTSRHEGLPNVLLEAQSLGIPVVAPDVGGVSEAMWHGVTGWAVTNATATALAERIIFCLRDRPWRQQAEQAAPTWVRERFSIPAMLRQTLSVYGL